MSILITAATSASAHKLKNQLDNAEVLLGDYNDLPAFMLKNMGLIKLPNPSSASYTHEMLALCLDNNVSTVYILNQQELALLRESELLFNEYNISIIDGETAI